MIVIVFGLPGTGKSYFAKQLAAILRAGYISSDLERKKLLAVKTYSDIEKSAVYDSMLNKMKEFIHRNKPLVLDATFYKDDIRKRFLAEIREKSDVVFIEIRSDEATVKGRLNKARPDSDADFEVYKKIKAQWEPLPEDHLVLYSTNNNIEGMLHKAADYLHVKHDESTN